MTTATAAPVTTTPVVIKTDAANTLSLKKSVGAIVAGAAVVVVVVVVISFNIVVVSPAIASSNALLVVGSAVVGARVVNSLHARGSAVVTTSDVPSADKTKVTVTIIGEPLSARHGVSLMGRLWSAIVSML